MEENEINIIDTIRAIKEYIKEFKKNRILFLVIPLFSAIIGMLISIYTTPKYTSRSTIMIEASSNSTMSGALALASQFGLSDSGGEISEDKLIEIISSETVLKMALLKECEIGNKKDLLANHFIELYDYDKLWEKNRDTLVNFSFSTQNKTVNRTENGVFKSFFEEITNNILKTDLSKSGIITIKVISKSEEFSNYFNQFILDATTSFYVDRVTEKSRSNLDLIQKRVDSIKFKLKESEAALAKWKDANLQLIKAEGLIEELNLRRDVEINNSIYMEGVKQLEISRFNLMKETPFIQVIDKPALPLQAQKVSIKKATLLGFIVGGLFTLIIVLGRKVYSDLIERVNLESKKAA